VANPNSEVRANTFFFFLVHSPYKSHQLDEDSAAPAVKKQSVDEDRKATIRTSGSPRTSLVDDRGVDPLSLHILKRTGTEAQLKYRASGSIAGDEGVLNRQGSIKTYQETVPGEGGSTAGAKSMANVGRGILGEVLGNESGNKKFSDLCCG
jgi:hypothetical protein